MSASRSLCAVFLCSLPALAQEYVRTAAETQDASVLCVTWSTRTFTYHVAIEGSTAIAGDLEFAAVDAAFATWQALSDTCSDFTFVRGEQVSSPKTGKGTSGENVVVFRESECHQVVPAGDPCWADSSCAAVYGCWPHSSTTIGLTTVTYSTRTGIAVDADIELNGADFVFTTVPSPPCTRTGQLSCVAYDVQNTLTHEIGHVVGFDHVSNQNSTMAPTAPLGETRKRIIDLGTANGFCGTYPRGQPPVPCDELSQLDRHVVAGTAGCGCHSAAAPLVILCLLPWAARRPRSRWRPPKARLQG